MTMTANEAAFADWCDLQWQGEVVVEPDAADHISQRRRQAGEPLPSLSDLDKDTE